MKIIFIVSGIILTSFQLPGTNVLCKDSEQVIVSFRLVNSKKSVSLCKGDNGKYIIYRFGTKDKTELQYPATLDASSWNNFKLYGIKRFGGKANAGFGDYSVSFINNKVEYEIFENWDDEQETREIGIKVIINGNTTLLRGDLKSKDGTLLKLDDEKDHIKNTAND